MNVRQGISFEKVSSLNKKESLYLYPIQIGLVDLQPWQHNTVYNLRYLYQSSFSGLYSSLVLHAELYSFF